MCPLRFQYPVEFLDAKRNDYTNNRERQLVENKTSGGQQHQQDKLNRFRITLGPELHTIGRMLHAVAAADCSLPNDHGWEQKPRDHRYAESCANNSNSIRHILAWIKPLSFAFEEPRDPIHEAIPPI